jgi:hypothetical protein
MSLPKTRDWGSYERRCEQERVAWLRSLTPAAALALVEDFHRFAASIEVDPQAAERVERKRWQEKLAIRRRVVAALSQLDQASGGRCDSRPPAAPSPESDP